MKQCGDVERVLGLASLGSGLLAAIVLSISVGADHWLLTDEPWAPVLGAPDAGPQPVGAAAPPAVPVVIMFGTYSGLWRACIYAKPDAGPQTGDGGKSTTEPPMDPSYEAGAEGEDVEGEDPGPDCTMISYFDQDGGRVDGGETSSAIWRGIRRATPVITFSLLLMIAAEVLAVLGYLREDFRTVISAILSIIAALSLALGQIFYISAVNDEASQWKRPDGATESQSFSYGYGWAFYSAGSSFVIVMVAAVGHITVYLRRYVTNDIRRMLIIVPGLNVRKIEAAAATNSANAAAAAASSSPSPTSPRAARHIERDLNGSAAPVHGIVESHAGVTNEITPTLSPRPARLPDMYSPCAPAIGFRPLPLQPGSSGGDDRGRRATLVMLSAENDPPLYQQLPMGPSATLTQHSGLMMTGSRVQSDIF